MNTEIKLWEAEFLAVNFETGVVEKIISTNYFQGVNFEDACSSLNKSKMPWLRLTGNWFKDTEAAVDNVEFYEKLTQPSVLTDEMSYDDFLDWLELGTEDDVKSAMEAFIKDGLDEHVKIMKLHLKMKYGKKENKKDDDKEER
tara:strand:+ start:179 stop:607 length:429 start_codon:yes stop_codon:yes gene_type:complete